MRRLLVSRGAVVALLGLMAVVAGLLATGSVAVVVTHGVSMEPTYHQGDLVVVARAPAYRRGDIAAYRLPGLIVLHRIIDGNSDGFVLQGDNNQSIDAARPAGKQLIGRAVLHVTQGGLWLNRAASPPMLALLGAILLLSGGAVARSRRTVLKARRRRRRTTVVRTPARPRRTMPTPAMLSTAQRTAAAVVGAIAVSAATLGALAYLGPTHNRVTTAAPPAPSVTFAYSATVPRTPAYDGTYVTSPQPVFRNLADSVEVRFNYQGPPGSVAVVADLTTTNGWRTTIPLAAPTAFSTDRYEGLVRLDLIDLEKRAADAATVIGLPAGAVSVAVTPRISTAAGVAVFAPTLRLSLTPLQLTLAGAPATLAVQAPSAPPRSTLVPRTLDLRGHQVITAAAARTVSGYLAFLTLGALLVAVAFVFATHRPVVPGGAEHIRRRYTSLLVRVDPMPVPAGRPVANVTDFRTLIRLAERYELLIMHWTRNDAETFVVYDEGTTYRYHCASTDSPALVNEDAPVPA